MFPLLSTVFAQAAAPNPFTKATFTTLEQSIPGFRFAGGNISAFFTGQYGISTLVFFIAGAIIVLYSISAGLGLMMSRGDPAAVNSSKQKLTNAIVGFIIVFSAYWVVQIVGLVLGAQGILQTF
jgi:hypothetical protein